MFQKINLLNLNKQELYDFFISIGEKSYRADQLMLWIYHNSCFDFNKMTNFSSNLINKLRSISCILLPKLFKIIYSSDGTIKILIEVEDNKYIETICIPYKNRITLCLSTQIGCVLDCKFCFTGRQKFIRNLFVFEIIGQILHTKNIIKNLRLKNCEFITNIVFMGMGEPLLNLQNVISSIKIMLDRFGFYFSKYKIVVSTSGIIPAIHSLFQSVDVVLAISLHASNDIVRNNIMPVNKKYDIKSLINVVSKYILTSKANRKVLSIEYIMIDGVNDSKIDAINLIHLLKNIPSKINLIPLNYFKGSYYNCSSHTNIKCFFDILVKHGLIVTVRENRGLDIHASCGQLSGIYLK